MSDAASEVPLCVDLDGTLTPSDLLHESLFYVLRRRPWAVLPLPLWWRHGKAAVKAELAVRAELDIALLPYHQELLGYLQQRPGSCWLVTGSDQKWASEVAAHLELFDGVMASDGTCNLTGQRKAQRLVERFGRRGFDYAGNDWADLPVWAEARRCIVVNAPPAVEQRLAASGAEIEKVFLRRARPKAKP